MLSEPLNVALISVNTERNPQPVYPLGLEYVRLACHEAGFKTQLFDMNVLDASYERLEAAMRATGPEFILAGIRNIDSIESQETRFYLSHIIETVSAARRGAPQAKVILGGSGFSLFPKELLNAADADYGVVGPGEGRIVDLLVSLKNGDENLATPGLVYRNGESIVCNPPARPTAFHGARLRDPALVEWYWQAGGVLNVQIQRGCRFSCIYCTYPQLEGGEIIRRDVAEAVDEIERLNREHGVDYFFAVDNVFNHDRLVSEAFPEEILRRNLKIRWTGFFSPRHVDAALARLWKKSGLIGIEFGIDSLAASVIRALRKPFSAEDMIHAAAACAAAEVPYSNYLIFAGPGETEETFEETIGICGQLRKAVFFALVGMRIYPGTELEAVARQEGVIESGEDLLQPKFYISRNIRWEYLTARLSELGKQPNWFIDGHGMSEKERVAELLRKRGLKGSLWELCTPES